MIGAITGDIVGSVYEAHNYRKKKKRKEKGAAQLIYKIT
jgi:hypothetical protein